jgi:hypothetical protein
MQGQSRPVRAPAFGRQVAPVKTMERLLYWVLFVVGMVLAAWLPAKSAFPELGGQVAHILMLAQK